MGRIMRKLGFPGGSNGQVSACSVGDPGSTPGSQEDPLEREMATQYSCQENPMDGEAWQATVHGVMKNRTLLSDFTFTIPGGADGNEPACQSSKLKSPGLDPWVRKIPWRRKWQPNPVFLPGESHGWRSLAGYSPWGHKELETTE